MLARHHLVHLHDRFNLRVIWNVADDFRAMLGERLLKLAGGAEFDVRDGEIGRLAPAGSDRPLSNSQLTSPSSFSRDTTSL
jgi:hypothetical protein